MCNSGGDKTPQTYVIITLGRLYTHSGRSYLRLTHTSTGSCTARPFALWYVVVAAFLDAVTEYQREPEPKLTVEMLCCSGVVCSYMYLGGHTSSVVSSDRLQI